MASESLSYHTDEVKDDALAPVAEDQAQAGLAGSTLPEYGQSEPHDEENNVRGETDTLLPVDTLSEHSITVATELRNQDTSLDMPRSRRSIGAHYRDVTYGSIELLSPWFPSTDPDHPRAKTWRTWHSKREVQLGIWLGLAITLLTLNFITTVVIWIKYPISSDRILTLLTGDCSTIKRVDTGLHVLINILSTLLLSASNACLQLLLAPTRAEVDKAHLQQTWLHIGVPSFRNLGYISRKRVCIWALLALSSIPLHFLYNAAVFVAIPSSSYTYALVTEAFLHDPSNGSVYDLTPSQYASFHEVPWADSRKSLLSEYNSSFANVVQMHNDVQANFSQYETLSSVDCWQEYAGNHFKVSPRSVLIVSNKTTDNSLLAWDTFGIQVMTNHEEFMMPVSVWTATDLYDGPEMSATNVDYWKAHGNQVQYCLRRSDTSQLRSLELCYLQASPYIMLVVCICNLVKCLSFSWVLFQTNKTKKISQLFRYANQERIERSRRDLIFKHSTLCTLGDAIASFLEIPDHTTIDLGIISWFEFKEVNKVWSGIKAVKWHPRRFRWYQAASNYRWASTMIISFLIILSGILNASRGWEELLHYSFVESSFQGMWSLGFGSTNSREMVDWKQPIKVSGVPISEVYPPAKAALLNAFKDTAGLFVNVLMGNIWQILLSLAYVLHNALLSGMLVGDEWAGFATERKPLRVSNPRGIQRSSYFISMPLRYGIPIMAFFSIEHWLLSQTIFLVRFIVSVSVNDGIQLEAFTTTGYSLPPAILAIILSVLFIIGEVLHAYLRKYPSSHLAMPLASTCSAAISSACHRPALDTDAYLLPVQWGVIRDYGKEDAIVDDSGQKLKRCAFTTARDTLMPEEGELFLGRSDDCQRRKEQRAEASKAKSKRANIIERLTGIWRLQGFFEKKLKRKK